MVFSSWRVLYCYVCFLLGCWLYPITKFTIPNIEGYREKWEHSLRIEWTRFGFCLLGYGLTVAQVRSYTWYIDVITVHNCNSWGWATTIFRTTIFLSTGVQLEAELAWRWWGALVASVFSRRSNFRSFFRCLRLKSPRAEYLNTNCNAGCGLRAPWRRGARVSEELGLLLHQVIDDRGLCSARGKS